MNNSLRLSGIILLLAVSNLSAATLHVPSGGSIQLAINEAAPGDLILVDNGVYGGGLNVNKPVALQSINGSSHCSLFDSGFELLPNQVRFFGVAAIIINVVRILGRLTVAADFCFEQEKTHLIGNRDVASFGLVGVKPDYTDFFNMAPKVLGTVN